MAGRGVAAASGMRQRGDAPMTLEADSSGALEWEGHLLLLYRSEAERRSQLAAWARRGLERDEKVIYAQDDTGPPQRSVLAVLAQQGIDAEAMTASGQLQVLPPAAVYGAGFGGQVTLINRALAEGYSGVRISGEVSTGPTVATPEEVYTGLDRHLKQLCGSYPLSVLCQCDLTSTVGRRLDRATANHLAGLRESQLQTAECDGALILAGEVDLSNEMVLLSIIQAATSSAATRTPSESFAVDLRWLTFLSVGGCRALAVGTQEFRDRGGCVLLMAPQWIVERVLQLFGLDTRVRVE
jgi:anti-anti-sigma factor